MENLHSFHQMQDEMSRFEAEIGVSNAAVGGFMGPVMATMDGYQHAGLTAMMYPPMPQPQPPPPQMMMVPQQVQRLRSSAYPVQLGPPSHHEFQPMHHHIQYYSWPDTQLMGPPPTPIVLSAKPVLYNKPKDEAKKDKCEKKRMRKAQLTAANKAAFGPVPMLMQPPPPPPLAHTEVVAKPKRERKNAKVVRTAGGQVWEDVTLLEWADDDYRIFCGDLGNDVTDELLIRTFAKYTSFQRAKVVCDRRTNKSKGFGFVSFKDPGDFIKAMKEMDGRYVGSRPIKLRKSTWKHRSLDVVRKKKEKEALISLLMTTTKN